MSAFGTKRTSGGGRFSFICALSASRGRVGDRAAHLIRNTLHGAIAYANFAGDLDDAHTGPQTILDALFNGCADPRPSEGLAAAR